MINKIKGLSMRFLGLGLALFVLGIILSLGPAHASASATFYMSPTTGSYKVGDKVTATFFVNTGGQAINAGQATVLFPSDVLQYESVSTSGSIFTFWTSGPTGGASSVSFGGGLSHPGYTGSSGKVLSITWKAKAAGAAVVTINDGSILADDGSGTNIYGGSHGGTFVVGSAPVATPKPVEVGAPVIKSTTHPDTTKWYNKNTVTLSWSCNTCQNYIYALDQSALTDPAGQLASDTTKTFDTVSDGVWYFHVKGKTATGLSPIGHFKVQIDTAPPDEFTVTVDQSASNANPAPKVTFEAKDATSGIDHYEVTIDGGQPLAIKSGDILPKQHPGNHTIHVKAFDKAGNVRESLAPFTIKGIDPPEIIDYTHVVGLLRSISFVGRSLPTDTIVVYIGDKEVGRFTAKDKQVPYNKLLEHYQTFAQDNEIAWQYDYPQFLLPGSYNFKFQRIDSTGAESAFTQFYNARVIAQTIQIGNFIINVNYIIYALLGMVLLLFLLIIFLDRKLHRASDMGQTGIMAFAKQIQGKLTRAEKEIMHDVDQAIPTHDMTAGDIKEAKKELKEKVHETIQDEENKL